jgi:hypothetical protein
MQRSVLASATSHILKDSVFTYINYSQLFEQMDTIYVTIQRICNEIQCIRRHKVNWLEYG